MNKFSWRYRPVRHRIVALLTLFLPLYLSTALFNFPTHAATEFVNHSGNQFMLNGSPFYGGGTNNYYLMYKSKLMVDDVLQDASDMGLKVIRHWASIDIGSLDGTVPHIDGGPKDGVYFQYWDTVTGKPAYNDGDTGLRKLDYIIKRAGELNLKVIPVMINNWSAFGGMDQYLNWYGLTNHDQFYTDSRVKQDYKNWLQHVITRVNSYTGIAYKDDPTIFAWELANEPRCVGSGAKPRSTNCTSATLTGWVDEMSSYIKSLDSNHMVSVGDEGFFTRPGSSDWAYNGNEGVDFDAYVNLPNIDFGTFHIYPEDWGKDIAWTTQWITDHVEAAHAANKPVLFEEFGFKDQTRRDYIYQLWTNTFCQTGGNAWTFWILTGVQDDGSLYPDYDRYRIVYPSDTASLLSTKASELEARQCGITPTLTPTLDITNTPTATRIPLNGALFEAEDGVLNGINISSNRAGYSGSGYVTGFDNDGDSVTVHVSVKTPGTYPLVIGYASEFSDKYQDVYVNGAYVGNILFALTPTFSETSVGNITLQPGDNTIEVRKSWGWVDVDYFLIVGAEADSPAPTSTPTPTSTPVAGLQFEAEKGTLNGVEIGTSRAGYSGAGYVTSLDNDGDSVTVHVEVATPGTYPLFIRYASEFGDKYQDIYVNGIFLGNMLFAQTPSFTYANMGNITLQPGDNTIEVRKSWGWIDVDHFLIVGATAPTPVPPTNTPEPTIAVPTNTAIPPTALPTNIPGRIRPRLDLTALCSPQPTLYRVWRVQNKTNAPVSFKWLLLGTRQSGTGFVPAQQSVTFQAITWQNRPNIVVIEANREVQDIALSSPRQCPN